MGASLGQRLAWAVETLAFDAFALVFRALPADAVSAFGGALLRVIGPLSGGTHRTAERNVRLAFPDMPAGERKRLLSAQW